MQSHCAPEYHPCKLPAREDTAGMIPGTARQKKRERVGRSEDRPQLEEKQAEEVNKQLSRHKIAVRKLGVD